MKTLLLLRHAKSDWSHEGQLDHDRTLNGRGRRDAPRIGQLLKAQGLEPDLILSSDAKRARKTTKKVVEGGELTARVELLAAFYLAAPKTYLQILQQQLDDVSRILIVGHNPGIEELSMILTGRPESFATGTLVQIEFGVAAWSEITMESRGTLCNIWRPREFED